MTPKQRNAIVRQLLKLRSERAKRRSVKRIVKTRGPKLTVTRESAENARCFSMALEAFDSMETRRLIRKTENRERES